MPLGFFEKPRIRSEGHCDLSSCFVLCPEGALVPEKRAPRNLTRLRARKSEAPPDVVAEMWGARR